MICFLRFKAKQQRLQYQSLYIYISILAMPLPAQVWEPICTGILEFLNGWVLVSFLATCKAARGCQAQLQHVQNVRLQVEHLNRFLRTAVRRDCLCLPGFDIGKLAEARLIPINPLPTLPGRNMMLLLDETYALNPCPATFANFREWLEDHFWPEDIGQTLDVGALVRDMHGADSALFCNPDLEALTTILCPHLEPAYSPSWATAGRGPVRVKGFEATRYPAFLLAWAECQGFPLLLYARAKISAIPWTCVFGSRNDLISMLLPGRR